MVVFAACAHARAYLQCVRSNLVRLRGLCVPPSGQEQPYMVLFVFPLLAAKTLVPKTASLSIITDLDSIVHPSASDVRQQVAGLWTDFGCYIGIGITIPARCQIKCVPFHMRLSGSPRKIFTFCIPPYVARPNVTWHPPAAAVEAIGILLNDRSSSSVRRGRAKPLSNASTCPCGVGMYVRFKNLLCCVILL